jgi:hypothetical protein
VSVDERERVTEKTVLLLKSIKTLEDLKKHKEEILDLMEEIFESAVQALNIFFDKSLSMSSDEKQKEAMKFQDGNYLFNEDIGNELNRIDNLPGAIEYIESFKEEMDRRMGPHLEDFTKQMSKLMSEFMGGMMGAVFGGMEEMMGGGKIDSVSEPAYEKEEKGHERSDLLYYLYDVNTPENLKENKDLLIETIEGQLTHDIWNLEVFSETPPEEAYDGDTEKIERIRNRVALLESEMEGELKRITGLPGMAEPAEKFRTEILERIGSKLIEIKDLLEKVK